MYSTTRAHIALDLPDEQDCTVDRHRGRTETRSLEVSCGMNHSLALLLRSWPTCAIGIWRGVSRARQL